MDRKKVDTLISKLKRDCKETREFIGDIKTRLHFISMTLEELEKQFKKEE